MFIKWYSNSFTQALCVEENWFMSKFSLNQLQLLFILEKLLLHHNVRNILNTYIQLLKFLSKDCNAKISYFCLFFNVSDPACLGSKPSRHPRVSDKILFTQQNSKTRCGFYTYRNITQNKNVAFFNSHNYILKIKIWYRWVIMILPYINFNVAARLGIRAVWVGKSFKINKHTRTFISNSRVHK